MAARKENNADRRRAELAESALRTLSELGYARTGVRDIAQNSPFSHGVLHYYFKDKVELIVEAVRLFKSRHAFDYDAILDSVRTPEELEDRVVGMMRASMGEEAAYHRLWYDLRVQGMYESAFREDIREIDASLRDLCDRAIHRYADLLGRRVVWPPELVYAVADGMFGQAVFDACAGDDGVADRLEAQARRLFRLLLAPE